jgi:hypothetical protein
MIMSFYLSVVCLIKGFNVRRVLTFPYSQDQIYFSRTANSIHISGALDIDILQVGKFGVWSFSFCMVFAGIHINVNLLSRGLQRMLVFVFMPVFFCRQTVRNLT